MSEKGSWNPGPKYTAYIRKIQDILGNGEERTVRGVYYALEARGFPDELRELSREHALNRHRENPAKYPHPDEEQRRISWDWKLERHREDPENNIHPSEDSDGGWMWEFEYRYVKKAVRDGRRAGYIDPTQIIDSSRQAVNTVSDGWTNPREFLDEQIRDVWDRYWENHWKYQDTYVEVWLEKAALASVFRPICREKAVRLEATRGDWSDSKVFEATQRLMEQLKAGKDVTILYFGDFNPSGYHAPVSILDGMEYYGLTFQREFPGSEDPRYYDPEHGLPARFAFEDGESASIDFRRCAINLDHIKQFDLPENPVPSDSDKDETIKGRFREHVSEGRDTNVELNALKEYHREFLEDLIRDAIDEHVDTDRRVRVSQRIREGRDALSTAVQIDDSELDERFNPPIQRPGDGDGDG